MQNNQQQPRRDTASGRPRFRAAMLAASSALALLGAGVATAEAGAISWTSAASGQWTTPGNWTGGQVPGIGAGTGADVTIAAPSKPTVTLNASGSTYTVNSINSTDPFVLQNGTLSIAKSSSFSGGYTQSGGSLTGAGQVTIADGTLAGGSMSGTGTTVLTGNSALTGNVSLSGSRVLDNQGTLDVGPKGSISASGTASVQNEGTLQRTIAGSSVPVINTAVKNSGTVDVENGELNLKGGVQGTGNVTVGSKGQLDLGANSTAGTATVASGGKLNVGTNSLTVGKDFNNGNAGSGNAFNARNGVLGTGAINAAGDTNQAIVIKGTASSAAGVTLDMGNIHVGDSVTKTYQIENTGTKGADLRGAIQTQMTNLNTPPVATITDARLSGSGVTAGNFGPLAVGGATGNLAVTFTGTSAGALSNQSVRAVNNFDNVVDQTLTITGAAYNLAKGTVNTTQPMQLGSYRVGDAATGRSISVTNSGPAGAYTESLVGSLTGVSGGAATVSGHTSFQSPLAVGGTNTDLAVKLDTSTAGVRNGSATVAFASDGGSNGLGQTALGTQTVQTTGKVYAAAVAGVTSPDFGIVHVGDSVSRGVTVQNNASGALTDTLRGTIATGTGPFAASGSIGGNGLAAGASDNSSIQVKLDTSKAGIFDGQATTQFVSHNPDMTDLALAPALVALHAQVNNYANLTFDQTPGHLGAATLSLGGGIFLLDFGKLKIHSGPYAAFLNLFNNVTGPADSGAGHFSGSGAFKLAGFGPFSGLGAGQSNGLEVDLDTMLKGLKAGQLVEDILLTWHGENGSGYVGPVEQLKLRLTATMVPEPATLAILGAGAFGLFAVRRRRRVA